MNELKIFECKEFGKVRTIYGQNKVMFCGSGIAKSLKYTNPNKAIKDHCKGITKRSTLTVDGNQKMLFDVYRLIAHSKLPTAERFERWVFDNVLVSIRKHGAYAKDELLDNPDLFILTS